MGGDVWVGFGGWIGIGKFEDWLAFAWLRTGDEGKGLEDWRKLNKFVNLIGMGWIIGGGEN